MNLPRVYPILDTQALAARGCEPETAARALLDGGARILQFRHKSQWTRATFEHAERIAAVCRESDAVFVVNDRADVAMLFRAGMHVGQDDLDPADVRRLLGPDAVVGYSTHNSERISEAAAARVNYFAFGPIFGTVSKQNPDPMVGIEQLERCRASCLRPLVAIGGITRQNARAVFAAGADTVAVIADLLPEPCTSATLRRRMEEWQQLAQK